MKISTLSINNYYGGLPSGSFSYSFDGGSAYLNLNQEDIEKILSVAYSAIERSKKSMIEKLNSIQSPKEINHNKEKKDYLTYKDGDIE